MIFLVILFLVNVSIAYVVNSTVGLTLEYVIAILFEYFLVLFIGIGIPLKRLRKALKVINFDLEQIDLTKVDSLKESGVGGLKFIIKRFKYLMDIIAERINRVNSETYKAEHDGLTDCYNRIKLEKMKGVYEFSNTVSIIFIDVNNLKRMNDECGHEAGDALLKTAASKLRFWGSYGDVYRLGGDEFMIVCVNKSQKEVSTLLKQWYPTVGQLNRDTDGFKCVLSYGVAHGRKGCKFDELEKLADDRMYDMKVAIKKKFGEPMR